MISMQKSPLIVMLTDFSTLDPFVGILKGVLSSVAPGIPLIDLTHEIPSGNVKRAAIILWQAISYFPPGCVFLGVVDPGVGTSRKAIIIESGYSKFIGPDNGLFSFVTLPDYHAWEITNSEVFLPNPSSTFHGRDVFAPAAAHAANGLPPESFGEPVPEIKFLTRPKLESIDGGGLKGEVLHADKFGNLLTSIGRFIPGDYQGYRFDPWLDIPAADGAPLFFSREKINLYLPNGKVIPWVNTFADAPEDKCACLVGGSGLLEIVRNRGSAAESLILEEGSTITLRAGGA
jgi:S-adenosyl-L-methionine hydrolase (adenosine-forming)